MSSNGEYVCTGISWHTQLLCKFNVYVVDIFRTKTSPFDLDKLSIADV